jgi:N-acylneuraminate cytidylyltransferase
LIKYDKVVALIPARGGSKSIPKKNVKSFCGKPLIYWNIAALAHLSPNIRVIVSTDSDEIESVVKSFGFNQISVHKRSAENSSDTASTESVMLEVIDDLRIDPETCLVLVQCTSPLTQSDHFKEGLNKYFTGYKDSVLSCVRTKRFFWNPDGTPLNYDYRIRPRRQDFEGLFMENGAFYINRVSNVIRDQNRLSGNIGIIEMPEWTSVEIDEPADWEMAERACRKYCS